MHDWDQTNGGQWNVSKRIRFSYLQYFISHRWAYYKSENIWEYHKYIKTNN